MNTLRLLRPIPWPSRTAVSGFHSSTRQPAWWTMKGPDALAPETRSIADLLKKSPKVAPQPVVERGRLADSSILGAEDEHISAATSEMDLSAIQKIRDPYRSNWGWPKRAAARELRRRGRLSRPQRIAQTEKEHIAKSHFFKTSYKKLGPLARQIAGKSYDDAVSQMRFSPKKAAKDVLAHLKHAAAEAVVRKDMDPSQMYVSQAWVGRGPYDRDLSHRARGRVDMLLLPHACITIQFKEQATLRRIAREKVEKRMRKAPRQHLPSRPIYGQRQYYQW